MNIRDLFARPQTTHFSPLSDSHRKRQSLFNVAWSYYLGRHRKFIKAQPNGPDDNVIENYSAEIVDQGIDFLFGEELVLEIDSNSTDRTPEEQYLDSVFGDAETKMSFLQKVAQNGAITGTPFVRLYPADPNVQGSLPRLINLDPGVVDIITADDDAEHVVSYHIVWKVGEVWKRQRIDWDVEAGVWTITPERAENDRKWIADGPIEEWPYLFAPVFHCQNLPLANSVWGISDLENADLNDAINRVSSNTNRIIRFHAHPKTIGTGFNASKLNATGVSEFWSVDDPAAKVFNLEMQSDLASSREYKQDLKTAFHKVAGASEFDPAVVNVGALSGFALKILYMPTLKRTQRKRNTYGGMLKDICKALFELAGMQPQEVTLVWHNPLPENGMEEAQTLEIDRRNGLSKVTYLERRGYNAADEMEKSSKEQDADMKAQQRSGALAQAMADLNGNGP